MEAAEGVLRRRHGDLGLVPLSREGPHRRQRPSWGSDDRGAGVGGATQGRTVGGARGGGPGGGAAAGGAGPFADEAGGGAWVADVLGEPGGTHRLPALSGDGLGGRQRAGGGRVQELGGGTVQASGDAQLDLRGRRGGAPPARRAA